MRTVIEVDQSNKIEQPRSTTIAFSDGVSFAIILPHKMKTEAVRDGRDRGYRIIRIEEMLEVLESK